MLKSILKTSGSIACLAWSSMVCATGLGGINVSSNLGQPLKAEIELVSVDKADKSSITAKLASVDAFKNAGIDFPYTLPKLKFEVINRDSANPTVKVTSAQPINEPFVTLLVEVSWSSGKLMREYTFLLDPEGFKAQEPKSPAVKPVEPVVATPAVAPVAAEPAVPVVPIPMPVPEAASAAQAEPAVTAAAQPVPQPASAVEPASSVEPASAVEAAPVATTEAVSAPATTTVISDALSKEGAIPVVESVPAAITVVHGDTLSKIAMQNKPAEVSLERMLVAMYRANPDAFMGKNMNRLMSGKIINLPDATAIDAIKQNEAVKVVRAQVGDWNTYRQQLAAARAESADKAARQEASGKITTAVAEQAAPGKSPAAEVLKLSKGEAPTDKTVGAGKATDQDKANAKEEEAVAQSKALKESQERTALLEKNVKDLQRLADLKKQEKDLAAPSSAVSAPAAATTTPAAAESSVKAASSAPAAATVKRAMATPKVVEQASLLDEVLEDPIKLGGVAAVLLAVVGGGLVIVRRRKHSAGATKAQSLKGEEEEESASGRFITPVAPSPETGDFTQTATPDSGFHATSEEVDPIAEADLFLTFGRVAQAEEVLKEALKSAPGNIAVKLKLLSIFVTRKDTDSFLKLATEIKDSGDEVAWNQAAQMGRELDPGNPLYGGAGATSIIEPVTQSSESAVDFDLGFGTASDVTKTAVNLRNVLEAEPTTEEKTSVLSIDELRSAKSTPMDFDVTGTNPSLAALNKPAASTSMDEMVFDVTTTHSGAAGVTANPSAEPIGKVVDDLVFDITATHPGLPAAEAPSSSAPKVDDTLAFTLDFPSTFKAPSTPKAEAVPDIGLGDISLNLEGLGSTPASPVSEGKDEHWQEVATKLDLAKAYQEMGDAAGVREILEEVLRDGDVQQRASAQAMLQQL